MNRSEELCKLLGIYKVKCTEDEQTSYTTSDEICNNCDPDYKNCWSRILIYPDLTKPSNFVKLLENIKIDGIELCDWLICYRGSFCNRQDFIGGLIEIIKEYTNVIGCLTKDIETIKQQAQATKWEN